MRSNFGNFLIGKLLEGILLNRKKYTMSIDSFMVNSTITMI